ncbi:MAG TPA: ATP-dependent DNA ligase [Blastocatellia bacterium]|nr:ATP-dependent DNA ligase [Blastocatellia bacterium]
MKFSKLAQAYDKISKASGDAGKVPILADLFKRADDKTLEALAHFTLGEAVSPQLSDRLGIGPGAIRDALAKISGDDPSEIEGRVKESGDMGEVAAEIVNGTDKLEVAELWKRINRVVERNEDRKQLVEHIFKNTTSAGAKYFARMVLNQMRIGVGEGTMERAIARAFKVDADSVQRLYAMTNDIGIAAREAKKGERALARANPILFQPYQFMNAQRVENAEEIFETFKDKQIIFDIKYDGVRLQIHIKSGRGGEIKLFSRRLNDDTASMPDVVEALKRSWKGKDAIIEGEAVAFDKSLKKKLPFQAVLMRRGRESEIEAKAKEIPLVLFVFDLLYDNGASLMDVPQRERRERLKKLFRETDRVRMTESIESNRAEDEERFFKRALKEKQEGLMAKDPAAIYEPGKRTDHWLKLKPAFETLDVVVVGGIWGSGRRRGLLSSLVIAVRDKGEFKTVGKVGTGFSEEMLKELTAKLKSKIIATRGLHVEIEPSMVIEVDFQGIQKTPRYSSGYALRIPRFKRERVDKSVREADTLERLVRLYKQAH